MGSYLWSKRLDKKAKVKFKIYVVTNWGIIARHIVKISRSKGNQGLKFNQLIECNMRNVFLEKSLTKFGGETSPRPFY